MDVHCWHAISEIVLAIPNPPYTQKCCHCNGTRVMVWDASITNGHGPYYDNPGDYVPREEEVS